MPLHSAINVFAELQKIAEICLQKVFCSILLCAVVNLNLGMLSQPKLQHGIAALHPVQMTAAACCLILCQVS